MKKIALLAAVVLFASAFAGCSGKTDAAGTITFWTISLKPLFTAYIKDIVKKYEAENPGVKVIWEDKQFQAFEQALLTAIAGGVAPDVVNLNTEMAIRLAERNALVNLDANVSRQNKKKYFSGLWGSASFRGATYGIPWYVTPNVIAYNEDIFRRAGLGPKNIGLPSESGVIDIARQIKDKTGKYGFMPNVDGVKMLHRFQENGLPILSPDGKKAVFNSAEHILYLTTYVELLRNDYFPEETVRKGYLGATERYSAGQLGMLITGPNFLLRVKNDNPAVYAKTRVIPYPHTLIVQHLPTMVLAIPKSGKHVKQAVDFALFVTNDENQLAFSKITVVFPSTKQAASDPFFRQGGPTPEDQARKIAAEALPRSRDLTVVVPNSGDLMRIFREAIESAFYGKRSPKEALDWAVEEWNKKLK